MFRKELQDTLKTFVYSLLLVVGTIIFSYFVVRHVLGIEIYFRDILVPLSWIALVVITFYLGSTIFSKERSGQVFEYFFSLPVPRWKALFYKVFPRFLAVFIFFLLYVLFSAAIYKDNPLMPMKPMVFFFFLLAVFLFTVSKSLMYKRTHTILIASIFIFSLFLIITWALAGVFGIYAGEIILSYFTLIIGVISLALFIGFVWRFRELEMNNMYQLSRRNVYHVMLPVAVLLFLFIGINLVDTGKPADLYTPADLVTTSFAKSNGFYRLWTLPEPPGTDVQADPVIDKYRKMFDPQFDNEKFQRQFQYTNYREEIKKFYTKMIISIETPGGTRPGIWKYLADPKTGLEKIKQEYSYILDRYQELVETPEVIDFSTPFAYNQPTFNYVVLLRVSRLYVAVNALDAVNGQWEQGVANILAHINFSRKMIRGSRFLITNLIGKAVTNTALHMLIALMNHEDCPQEVYKQILAGLPPLKNGDFGTTNSFIFESLLFNDYLEKGIYNEIQQNSDLSARIRRNLFTQENRTIGYMHQHTKEIIHLEETPPFQWETNLPVHLKTSGAFWWLINPGGKMAFSHWYTNFHTIIFKTYRTRTFYDMTRICAEFHLKDDPAKPAAEVLKQLDTYSKMIDPCSGQPYKWNARKNVLYSIGTDRNDDNGKYDTTTLDTDFAVPIHLKGRN